MIAFFLPDTWHIVSNSILVVSCFAIATAIFWIVIQHKYAPLKWRFILLAVFFTVNGISQLIDTFLPIHLNGWLSISFEAILGFFGFLSAVTLIWKISPIMDLPFTTKLQEANQVQKALRGNEGLYRLLAENSTDIISISSIEGVYIYVSPASEKILGYYPQELVGKSIYDLFPPPENPPWFKTDESINSVDFQQLSEEDNNYLYTCQVSHKNGDQIYLEISQKLVDNPSNSDIKEILSVARDVTQRKQIEKAIAILNEDLEARVKRRTQELETANHQKDELLEQQIRAKAQIKLYKDIVENIPTGFCIWHLEDIEDDTSLRLVTANPAAAEILDIDLRQDIGKNMGECFPNMLADENQELLKTYAEVARFGKTVYLNEIEYKDQRVEPAFFSVKVFGLPGICMAIAFDNITEKKQAQVALIESEWLYRTVVNNVKEIIFQTDFLGRWTFLSAAWKDITGYSTDESLNKPLIDWIYEQEDKQHVSTILSSLINEKKESSKIEFRIQRKDNSFRWLEMRVQLRCSSSGLIMGTWGTLNDVTERKLTEAMLAARAEQLSKVNSDLLEAKVKLEQRNDELDQFAYVASHDLKAPLRAISNLSEWLEEDLEEVLTPDTKHQMELMRSRVSRMECLINGLLKYSRAGRAAFDKEEVVISDLLSEIIDSLNPNPEFQIIIGENMPTLQTQRLPLQQVFSNLIGNAIKHHHCSEGIINISVSDVNTDENQLGRDSHTQYYRFTVQDDGPGIESELQNKIFTIFETLKPRDKEENSGIGLAIVKKIVESQGGSIHLESESGKGSAFSFTWRI